MAIDKKVDAIVYVLFQLNISLLVFCIQLILAVY
jgi:hypothetical protein